MKGIKHKMSKSSNFTETGDYPGVRSCRNELELGGDNKRKQGSLGGGDISAPKLTM